MRRLSWIIQMGPKHHLKCPHRREAEEDLIHTEEKERGRRSRERFKVAGF